MSEEPKKEEQPKEEPPKEEEEIKLSWHPL